MIPFAESAVEAVFNFYPERARPTMFALRDLVFTTSQRLGLSNHLTETLKWGEPSYLSKTGSTLRIHWKEADPNGCRLFFHCQTSLVETFRALYPGVFVYEGNRAIRVGVGEEIDLDRLGHCIELSLQYHEIKHLPLLGVKVDRD